MSSQTRTPQTQYVEFHHYEPPSVLHKPVYPLSLGPPLGPPPRERGVSDANATWLSLPTLAGPSSGTVAQDISSLIPFSPPHPSPPPLIHSPRPVIPLAPFTPHPPSPAHRLSSLIPLSFSPVNLPMLSVENTGALNVWADSPGSALSSLPSTPVNFSSADAEPGTDELPVVDPDTTDFAAVVIGIELSPETPSLDWPNGFRTAVPFIPDPQNPNKNKLSLVRTLITNIFKSNRLFRMKGQSEVLQPCQRQNLRRS